MQYVSTRGSAPPVGFDEALVRGLAPDGGLYVPAEWPRLDEIPSGDYPEVASAVVAPFMAGSVVESRVEELVAEAYRHFRHPEVAPLRELEEGRHLLELHWGPTLSFKDYALQLVGRLFDAVLSARGEKVLVLGATSGDTGSAAIEACRDREAIEVVILYPAGRVSEVQRRQMTTVDSPNVMAVEVEGTFDDCQDLVKSALARPRRGRRLAAVNSINWARVMAQAAYYVWIASRLERPFRPAVPTGNFGNVYAASVARRMGAPIERLLVANNANHGLADLIGGGRLDRQAVVPTLAPAMDIAVPSNLERTLFELTGRDGAATAGLVAAYRGEGAIVLDPSSRREVRSLFAATWVDDEGIEESIRRSHQRWGLVVDPHTATALAAVESLAGAGETVVAVATAHPAKFPEAVEAAIGVSPGLPPDLADIFDRPERVRTIPASSDALEDLLGAVAQV